MITPVEEKQLHKLTKELTKVQPHNEEVEKFYEAKNDARSISEVKLSSDVLSAKTSLSWAYIVVEALISRINAQGYYAPEGSDANTIWHRNNMNAKSKLNDRETAIFGTGYMMVSEGDTSLGEAPELWTVESAKLCYGQKDVRTGLLKNFLKIVPEGGPNGEDVGFFINSEEIIYFEVEGFKDDVREVLDGNLKFSEISRVKNKLPGGTIPVAVFNNMERPSHPYGQSEISPSVRSAMVTGMQTFENMRTAGETFSTPQRYFLNVNTENFKNADGKISPVQAYKTMLYAISPNKNKDGSIGTAPIAGQFDPSSPEPFIEVIKTAALQIAAEKGLPETYFGYHGDQPSSADAIRVQESRLIKNAEDRMTAWGPGYVELLRITYLMRDGKVPEGFDDVRVAWAPAASATPAADADANMKNISSGIYTADSPTAQRMAGIPAAEWKENQRLKVKADRAAIIDNIKANADAIRATNPIVDKTANTNNATERTGVEDE